MGSQSELNDKEEDAEVQEEGNKEIEARKKEMAKIYEKKLIESLRSLGELSSDEERRIDAKK